MPNPTRSDVHVNRPLGSISVAFTQENANWIHDKVFPIVGVSKQSDRYFTYDRSYWLRAGAEKRAPATEAVGSGWSVDSSPTFMCDVWAYKVDLDYQTIQSADEPIDLQRDAVEFVTQKMMLRREKLFTQRFLSPGVWGGYQLTIDGKKKAQDYTPDKPWSDDDSNPIAEIARLKVEGQRQTGYKMNTLVVTTDVNERLKQHPLILSRILFSQLGVGTEELLAQFFGVDKYLVSDAIENTAQEGQVGQYNFINDNKFLLCYAAPSPGLMKPTAGYIFSWTGMYGASAIGGRIKTYDLVHLNAERVEMEMAFDMQQISAEMGILGTNLLREGGSTTSAPVPSASATGIVA